MAVKMKTEYLLGHRVRKFGIVHFGGAKHSAEERLRKISTIVDKADKPKLGEYIERSQSLRRHSGYPEIAILKAPIANVHLRDKPLRSSREITYSMAE